MSAHRSLTPPQTFRWGRGARLVVLTALAMLLVLLFASTGLARASAARTPPGKAWVRAAHLVPGIGSVRIDLDSSSGAAASSILMSPGATYGKVTDYQKVAPGTYTVNVHDSGATSGTSPMLSRSFTVKAGQAMTLAVLGTKQAPRLAALTDDLTPPAAGTASVRVLPAASATPEVTVKAVGGPTITSNAVLGEATRYAAVPAGTWNLHLTADNGRTAAQTVRVASGSVYTLVVLDGSAGTVRLQGIVDAAGAMAAPKGGAATGGGGMADHIDGYATSSRSAALVGSTSSALPAIGVAATLLVLLARASRRRQRAARFAVGGRRTHS